MVTIGVPATQVSATGRPLTVRRRTVRQFLAGWWDGRRGLPQVRNGAVVLTGHMLAIRSENREQLDAVHVRLLDRTRTDRVEYAGLAPRLAHLQELSEEPVAKLASLRAQGPRQGRRMGEDALTEDQVQRRRIREHEAALQRAARRAADVREETAALQRRRLELHAQVDASLQDARAEGERICGRAEQRMASYLKGAALTHPDPASLTRAGALLRAADRAWLTKTSAADLMAAQEEEL